MEGMASPRICDCATIIMEGPILRYRALRWQQVKCGSNS